MTNEGYNVVGYNTHEQTTSDHNAVICSSGGHWHQIFCTQLTTKNTTVQMLQSMWQQYTAYKHDNVLLSNVAFVQGWP